MGDNYESSGRSFIWEVRYKSRNFKNIIASYKKGKSPPAVYFHDRRMAKP